MISDNWWMSTTSYADFIHKATYTHRWYSCTQWCWLVYSLTKLCDLFRSVLADIVLLIVHAYDTPVHREQRSLQTLRYRPVEVFPLVLRHVEYDLTWISNTMPLYNRQTSPYRRISMSKYDSISQWKSGKLDPRSSKKPLYWSSPKFAWLIMSGTPTPTQNFVTIQLPLSSPKYEKIHIKWLS